MWFRSLSNSLKSQPSVAAVRWPFRRPTTRPRVEALEDRSLMSCIASLAANEDSPLVGDRVALTATAEGCGAAPVYQFSVAPQGGEPQIVRDFSPSNSLAWTPMMEGNYDIQVVIKDGYV